MKLRTFGRLFIEGVVNLKRYASLSFSGVVIAWIAFIVFGIFFLFSRVVSINIEQLEKNPELEVFLYVDATADQIEEVESFLQQSIEVVSYEFIDKETAFMKAKELVGEEDELLESFGKSFLPTSFIIDLDNPKEAKSVYRPLLSQKMIESYKYVGELVNWLDSFENSVLVVLQVMFFLLLFFTYLLISSVLKLSVNSRKKEIAIKKLFGAKKIFIRLPFVIEGVIISLVSALLAFFSLKQLYVILFNRIEGSFDSSVIGFIKVVPFSYLDNVLLLHLIVIALFFGTIASVLATRRNFKIGG